VNALQVAPAELEAVLLENEHIADAAVVGITLYGFPPLIQVLADVFPAMTKSGHGPTSSCKKSRRAR